MRIVRVFTKDRHGYIRLWRFTWIKGKVGDGKGYSAKFSIGLFPRLFRWWPEGSHRRELIILGVRLSWDRSYGGIFS